MIIVFALQLEATAYDPEFQDLLLSYLPEAGRLRIKDHTNPTSRLQTVAGELLARHSVGEFTGNASQEIKLVYGEKGKPHIQNLSDVHFNISHSGHYVVCAVADKEIGVDVERIRKVNLRIAERFFSAPELFDLMQLDEEARKLYFITLWTIKESYLKAIGRGLTQHLNSFTILQSADSYMLTGNKEAEGYGIVTQLLDKEYMMAVCAPLPYSLSSITTIGLKEIMVTLPKYI